MGLKLTKLDVARRQLAVAIGMFFRDDEPVSIFTLAANAWEVIDALCVRNGVQSMSVQSREYIEAGKDLKRDYVNVPYRNFFKHADKDPVDVLEDFDSSMVDGLLFLAVEDYLRLVQRSPVQFQVYQLWYLATRPEKISPEELEQILQDIDDIFPNIRSLLRVEQLALGRKVMADALANQNLQQDPKTEPAW